MINKPSNDQENVVVVHAMRQSIVAYVYKIQKMEKVMAFAEQLIETHAPPNMKTRYLRHKNKILFGSLSKIISQFQTENQDMKRKIDELKTRQDHSLTETIMEQMHSIIALYSPCAENISTVDQLCNTLHSTMSSYEKQARVDIERYRSNRLKFQKLIRETRHQNTEPASVETHVDEMQRELAELKAEIRELNEELIHVSDQNDQLLDATDSNEDMIEQVQSKLEKMAPIRRDLEEKTTDMRDFKESLTKDIINTTNKVAKTKLIQRFGRVVKESSHKPKVDQMLALRAEVDVLSSRSESLKHQKKLAMINQVKTSQRSYTAIRL